MIILKQSTASQAIKIGPFVSSGDGVTPATGLTIANTDIQLSKAGGTLSSKNSGGGTHDANGWYTITLDATDTATVGPLQLTCNMGSALPVFATFQVVEEAVYDALFGASATGKLPATLSSADVSGNIPADIVAVQGHTISGTGTQIADAFETFFNVADPLSMSTTETLLRLAASVVGAVEVTDNGATLTLSFKDTDGVTEVRNLTYTKSTGARGQN